MSRTKTFVKDVMGRFSLEESCEEEDTLTSKRRRCDSDDVEPLESEEHEIEESEEEGDDEMEDETGEELFSLRVGNRDHGFNFRIDEDVFDCSVCFNLLRPPIFQCKNGHIACSSCRPKLHNKCHVCTQFIGRRCLALEKVIESIKCQCQYFKYGCRVTLSFTEKASHEETCSHAPLFCPISGCTFSSSKHVLAAHVKRKHHSIVKKFVYDRPFLFFLKKNEPFMFLLGQNSQLFLLLNTLNTHPGKALFVICIDSSKTKPTFTYDLTVHSGDSSLQLKTSVEKVEKWDGLNPPKPILTVPDNFYTSNDEMHVSVCIREATGIRKAAGIL
ncbi:putative E3 ubiquitin-protein ligase SINA-like 6 [Platanthera zijinensis]|uniref:RING-type E3 ubiquitin transferase n=1 Tax=Platanthera zijinensis TaxID=2320716 RepID=A0AAP0FUK4_9ASPA